jgi:hypothetical protein
MVEQIKDGEKNRENGTRRIGKRVRPAFGNDSSIRRRIELDKLTK